MPSSAEPSKRRAWLRRAGVVAGVIAALVIVVAVTMRVRYGGGAPYPDRSGRPARSASELEVVAALDHPPGNVAVSAEGRVFFTFHPDGRPPVKVAELVHGRPRAYPDAAWQHDRGEEPFFHTPLSLRVDRQNRLWVLDLAEHGSGIPRLVAFDLATNELVHEHRFSSEHAPLGSHLNDFAVHPEGDRIYIADASIFGKSPALLVYDIRRRRARRLLEQHRSVMPDDHVITVEGVPQVELGIFTIRPGVDSITLDRRGEWLYYAAMTSNHYWRVRSRDLDDTSLDAGALARRVERLGEKPVSDGITIDDAGTIWMGDPEHSSIVTFDPPGRMATVFRDRRRLRWPDGFSFGLDGWLYVTCSALQHVIMESEATIAAHRPYHIYRFRSGRTAAPGH